MVNSMKFEAYKFVKEVSDACDETTRYDSGTLNYTRAYGKFVGFMTFALSNMDLNDAQVAEFNRCLEVLKKG